MIRTAASLLSPPSQDALHTLAQRAGLLVHWDDAAGQSHTVSLDVLRALLDAMGLRCGNAAQCRDSLAYLESPASLSDEAQIVTRVGVPATLPALSLTAGRKRLAYRIHLEDGETVDGTTEIDPDSGASLIPSMDVPGYHHLEIGNVRLSLIVAPPHAHRLPATARHWGMSVPLYGLRSEGDGGLGHYGALADAAAAVAAHGAHALAISPAHAMFGARPAQYSPYSPSNRQWYNVAHIDPAALCGMPEAMEAARRLRLISGYAQRERQRLVNWPAASVARLQVLRHLYDQREHWLSADQAGSLKRFRRDGRDSLEAHARFEMLHERLHSTHGDDWRRWPPGLRSPWAPQAERLAFEHADAVTFHVFLQWLAFQGLHDAHRQAQAAGMEIGLIADMAVGVDSTGSEAWSDAGHLLEGISLGAPPDAFNPAGQVWGLTTFSPWAFQQRGYRPFIAALRAALAFSGGVRIDHVLGLSRLWVCPAGAPASAGAYLRYPLDELLAIVALESSRHRAIVIGEDLGTVPADFRARVATQGVLGTDVLWFARDDVPPGPKKTPRAFLDPSQWRVDAVATTSTHDLPTAVGWWTGRDIAWRVRLAPSSIDARIARRVRREDRTALWQAMSAAGVVNESGHAAAPQPPGPASDARMAERLPSPAGRAPSTAPLDAIVDFVALAPSALVLLPIADAIGAQEADNLPGTTTEHPNWRRRLRAPADALLREPDVASRLTRFARTRSASARRSVRS
ncbi:4-alpha-glucanotransferase [Pandoraea faecigallinarum]|uniref:4-alpha-glucanotransferase n=1 Tax=Pandoraea faecigallinarum TaxID=656179 RepID=A0A0H3WXC8_9BURK|nr:4-alpha-glucanotransferase [Pandoraea faecigallinarum]AKM32290.1 4-alpha-glucanotransferase [Pandoraea faecigallinarum]